MNVPQPRMKRGYWYIRISGRDYYLGKDLETANGRAAELIAEKMKGSPLLFSAAIEYWLRLVQPTVSASTYHVYTSLARSILRLIKGMEMKQFTKLYYSELLNRFAETGKSRGTIKIYRHVILESLRYAEIRDLIPNGTYAAFQIIPLPRNAKQPKRITPTCAEELDQVREAVGETVYDVLRLEALTGMRPCELLSLCPRDIVKLPSGVWQYVIYRHKTCGRTGTPLIKYIGPKAQEILERYIADAKPDEPLFKRRNGKPHTTHSVQQRISYLKRTRRDFPQTFHQYKCRHAAGTEARKHQGLEGAQAFLGHASRATSEIYAEVNQDLAISLALEIG